MSAAEHPDPPPGGLNNFYCMSLGTDQHQWTHCAIAIGHKHVDTCQDGNHGPCYAYGTGNDGVCSVQDGRAADEPQNDLSGPLFWGAAWREPGTVKTPGLLCVSVRE